MHIMWYEVDMVYETLDSLQLALDNASNCCVDLKFCFNHQTYLEDIGDILPGELLKQVENHSIFKSREVEIIHKTNSDSFYNIGDWRRENYGDKYDYYIWGESDCLLPECFFYNLGNIEYDKPHVVSYAQRKMWDNSWLPVEHILLQGISCTSDLSLIEPLGQGYISLEQLNSFNKVFPTILLELPVVKIDGNLTTVSKGLPTPILPEDLHFIHEDLALQLWLQLHEVSQLHFPNQIKGHNFQHPKKRKYTKTKIGEDLYVQYKNQSMNAIQKLSTQLQNKIQNGNINNRT